MISDNIGLFKADHADYLAWLRDPVNGFDSSPLIMGELCELSVKR